MDNSRPRDLIGYGRRPPQADWPHKARIALSFVLNYEEGGERNVMDGDPHAEIYVTPEMTGMLPVKRRSRSRPRDNRDMTVPIGTPSTRAASS